MEYRLPPSFTVLDGSKRSSQSMATYRLCEQPTLVQYSPLLSRTHFLTHTTGNYRFPISCDATLIMGPMRTAGGTFTDLTSDQEFVDEIRRRTRGRKEFKGKSIKKGKKCYGGGISGISHWLMATWRRLVAHSSQCTPGLPQPQIKTKVSQFFMGKEK